MRATPSTHNARCERAKLVCTMHDSMHTMRKERTLFGMLTPFRFLLYNEFKLNSLWQVGYLRNNLCDFHRPRSLPPHFYVRQRLELGIRLKISDVLISI